MPATSLPRRCRGTSLKGSLKGSSYFSFKRRDRARSTKGQPAVHLHRGPTTRSTAAWRTVTFVLTASAAAMLSKSVTSSSLVGRGCVLPITNRCSEQQQQQHARGERACTCREGGVAGAEATRFCPTRQRLRRRCTVPSYETMATFTISSVSLSFSGLFGFTGFFGRASYGRFLLPSLPSCVPL